MNIFIHEIKAYGKSTVMWTAALALLVVLFMSMFPSISSDIEEFKKVLEGFPEGVRKAFGIQVDTIGSVTGFYSYTFLYLSLCGAIQGMNIGISIISKENRHKTADFLLTKPVKRTTILSAKLLASLSLIIMTNIVFIASSSIMANLVTSEEFSVKIFLMISVTLFFIQVLFLILGILISVVFTKIKSVVSVSLAIVFLFFIIGMVASAGGDMGRYFSPFKYFDASYIMKHASYETPFIFVSMGVIVVSLVCSYIVFNKKDIHSV